MAARRKSPRQSPSDLEGQSDPRAPLDSKKLLEAARPVLAKLAEDLLKRAKGSPAVTAALEARHRVEQAARRTADPFAVWQTNLVDQVAAAWLLSCVFVRTLEDRGLLAQARLAGPGAADSQRGFFDLAPSLAEREYLLTVFRELSRFPAARDLFDAKHNPVWLLTPSAEAAKALLGLFRLPSPEAPTFRFGQADTRFLGDLYQDLNEAVQKRYALLQTPRFVESFILDRTLERAIERFGLDETTVIDPTCGSGHFLLGSFDRLVEHRLHAEPGLGVREAARKALDAVYGADINPYAVGIARFRLTLAYLEKAGFNRLVEAPALPLHIVVADSLLHNAQLAQASFLELHGQSAEAWAGQVYALEDERAAREILHRRYAAVVGNPPYITVKDKVLRDRYREHYSSAFREYSLGVPFTERFFQLARPEGRIGMITANSFMKREFGKKLIEEYLPTVNVDLIVNTSGAYIPGHGTPTVLLFGTAAAPQGTESIAVLAKRGEPTTPENAEQGLVWRSIADHWEDVGFENDYVSVSRIARTSLMRHPWSLGGGGAAELKELLEARAPTKLDELVELIGFGAVTREDDVFAIERHAATRWQLPGEAVAAYGYGEAVRDWSFQHDMDVVFPYGKDGTLPINQLGRYGELLWRYRTQLWLRQGKGFKTKRDSGGEYYEYSMFYPERHFVLLKIVFAFVATHNHFVLDRGGKVFKQSAPIIKLPETATEDDHLALLAYLNSSTACFWMKQVMMNKGATSDRGVLQADEDKFRFEFDGTKMHGVPLPPPKHRARMIKLALETSKAAGAIVEENYVRAFDEHLNCNHEQSILTKLTEIDELHEGSLRRAVALQEEIDWLVYDAFGLTSGIDSTFLTDDELTTAEIEPSQRPFLTGGRGGAAFAVRWALVSQSDYLALLESAEYKRRWYRSQGKFNASAVTNDTLKRGALERVLLETIENYLGSQHESVPARQIQGASGKLLDAFSPVVESLGYNGTTWSYLSERIQQEAVPFIAANRYTDAGLVKRTVWEHTWDLQRREDAGEKVGEIPVPPKYDPKDFRDPIYWRLRGKLDVPKERFISYPGCESDQDNEPVYGWAGWNHLQQAQALAALYQKRKTEEAWEKDRLTPMLAGLLELLPWIKQWHNDPSDEYAGMRLGDFFEGFLDGECRTLGLTRDDLRAWRPEAKKRGKAAGRRKKAASRDDDEIVPDD